VALLGRQPAGVGVVHESATAIPAFHHVVTLGRTGIAGLHRRLFGDHFQLSLALRTSLRNCVASIKERHGESPRCTLFAPDCSLKRPSVMSRSRRARKIASFVLSQAKKSPPEDECRIAPEKIHDGMMIRGDARCRA